MCSCNKRPQRGALLVIISKRCVGGTCAVNVFRKSEKEGFEASRRHEQTQPLTGHCEMIAVSSRGEPTTVIAFSLAVASLLLLLSDDGRLKGARGRRVGGGAEQRLRGGGRAVLRKEPAAV